MPDTLLMPLVPAVMLATWTLRDPSALHRRRPWAALALLLGLRILAKYTGVFVVAASLASLIGFHRRRLARAPGFWWTLLALAAAATPVVGWNLAHHWASLGYQTGHALGHATWRPALAIRAALLQPLMYGGLLPVGVVLALRRPPHGCRAGATAASVAARRMGLLFGMPMLAAFCVLAGFGTSLPHWSAGGWMGLLPLGMAGCLQLSRRSVVALVAWQGLVLVARLVVVETAGIGGERGQAAVSGSSSTGAHAAWS